jgi:hypothetical protein
MWRQLVLTNGRTAAICRTITSAVRLTSPDYWIKAPILYIELLLQLFD